MRVDFCMLVVTIMFEDTGDTMMVDEITGNEKNYYKNCIRTQLAAYLYLTYLEREEET